MSSSVPPPRPRAREALPGDCELKINGREGKEKKGKPPGESWTADPAERGKKNRDSQLFLPGSQLWVMEFRGSLWEFLDFWGRARSGSFGEEHCVLKGLERRVPAGAENRRFIRSKGHKEPFLGRLFPDTAGNCWRPAAAAPKALGEVIFKSNAGLKPEQTANIILEQGPTSPSPVS